MWLAIDAGNSNIVVGVFESGGGDPLAGAPNFALAPRPLHTFRLSTYLSGNLSSHHVGTADELRARVFSAWHSSLALAASTAGATPKAPPTAAEFLNLPIVLTSVVPAFTKIARQAFPTIQVIDSTWPFSFQILTRHPERTGIDRLVNTEAVVREYATRAGNEDAPWLVIDSGTATTICALTAKREFFGGAICPGLETSRDALASRGAQLFTVELTPPKNAIGRDTIEALQSGVVLGYAAMIDGLIERFSQELASRAPHGAKPRVIATGGAAPLLREICSRIDFMDPDLMVKGVAYLYATRTHRAL